MSLLGQCTVQSVLVSKGLFVLSSGNEGGGIVDGVVKGTCAGKCLGGCKGSKGGVDEMLLKGVETLKYAFLRLSTDTVSAEKTKSFGCV